MIHEPNQTFFHHVVDGRNPAMITSCYIFEDPMKSGIVSI